MGLLSVIITNNNLLLKYSVLCIRYIRLYWICFFFWYSVVALCCCCCTVVTVIADDFIESLSMIHQFQWVYIRWWINDETIFKSPKWLVLIDSHNSKRKRWKLNVNERVPSGKINSFQCYLLNTNLISIGNGNR